jgi:hypothetical protein
MYGMTSAVVATAKSGQRRIARPERMSSLFDFGAGVSVDFQPDRDLDDDRGLPLHGRFP